MICWFFARELSWNYMKRIAILMVVLASMGAGCWSDDTARVPAPAAPTPVSTVQQPAQPATNPDAVVPTPATGTVGQVPPVVTPPVAPKPDDEPTYVTMKMSQDGFNPAQITIKKNTIVRFTNVGNGDMWPASNPHPSHTAYQDFDARRHVKPGETYEFKFKNVGKWGCHDHLSPGLTCRIVVEE